MSDYDSSPGRYDSDDEERVVKSKAANKRNRDENATSQQQDAPRDILDFSEDDEDSSNDDSGLKRRRKENGRRRKWSGGLVGEDDESDSDDDEDIRKSSSDGDNNESNNSSKEPLHTMLAKLLLLLKIDESVGEAYSRLTEASDASSSSSSPTAAATTSPSALESKALLHQLTKDLLALHNVATLNKDRDEIVQLYYSDGMSSARASKEDKAVPFASAAGVDVPPLPAAYGIEWQHSKGVYFGPFTAQQMEAWKGKGVFNAKKAMAKDFNAKDGGKWLDAATIDTY